MISVLQDILRSMDGPFRVSAAILGMKMQTLMATVTLLQLLNIIPRQSNCSKCSHKIVREVKMDGNYLYWWCSSCWIKTPIRRGTVLANSNLKLERFVLLSADVLICQQRYLFVYLFCFLLIWPNQQSNLQTLGSTYEQMVNEACLPTTPGYKECSMSYSTISKWFKYFTYICGKDYDETNHKIGGEKEIVEIDESLFGKPNYSTGDFSKRRRKWVFGGVDRRTRRAFVEICPKNKRTKKALWLIIQAYILPQTTIFSDGWRAYLYL